MGGAFCRTPWSGGRPALEENPYPNADEVTMSTAAGDKGAGRAKRPGKAVSAIQIPRSARLTPTASLTPRIIRAPFPHRPSHTQSANSESPFALSGPDRLCRHLLHAPERPGGGQNGSRPTRHGRRGVTARHRSWPRHLAKAPHVRG